jgi:hypothetical protein
MWRRVLAPGLSGGLVMVVWMIVVNGLLGFRSEIDMNRIPDEPQVYQVLKAKITDPGRYVCNPTLSDSGTFPAGEPVYGILYGGMGHEAAGGLALFQFFLIFILPILAVWMLSCAGNEVLSSYSRKVLFFAGIGLLVGVSSYLADFGIGSYPLGSAAALALHDLALWTVAGLVMAWRVRPVST